MALLSDVIQRGTRAAQPAATAVATGVLYGVTDEGNLIERSNGTTWDEYSPTVGSGTLTIATLALTHADITGMFAAPITVVAAQGAGTVIVPVFAVMTFNTSAGAYTTGGAPGLYWNGANPAIMTFPVTGMTGAATTVAIGAVPSALATQANGVNQELTISNASFAYASGNAANTADLVLGYYVATP